MRASRWDRAVKLRRATLAERDPTGKPLRNQAASSPTSFWTIASAAGPALISDAEAVMT